MTDLPAYLALLQKRMPAETRVLFESVARRHVLHPMAEQAA
jgi:hypothetical protein